MNKVSPKERRIAKEADALRKNLEKRKQQVAEREKLKKDKEASK